MVRMGWNRLIFRFLCGNICVWVEKGVYLNVFLFLVECCLIVRWVCKVEIVDGKDDFYLGG